MFNTCELVLYEYDAVDDDPLVKFAVVPFAYVILAVSIDVGAL